MNLLKLLFEGFNMTLSMLKKILIFIIFLSKVALFLVDSMKGSFTSLEICHISWSRIWALSN